MWIIELNLLYDWLSICLLFSSTLLMERARNKSIQYLICDLTALIFY